MAARALVRPSVWRGLVCPADSAHGTVVALTMPDGSTLWHCSHADHCGRPKTHPAGAGSSSRATFTLDEVESAMAATA